jgi:hypothetical protein
MKTKEDVESFERLVVQLRGLHDELSLLAQKKPNDALNLFKLNLVNQILKIANEILKAEYKPFETFDQFDANDLPTNSDVTLMLTQYIEQLERFRSANVAKPNYDWVYVLDGKPSKITTSAPTRLRVKS